MRHTGEDRRVHTCFITKNREYHIRAGECVAVRDRESSVWIAGHKAVGMRMRELPPGTIFLGRELELFSPESMVITSRVVDILRPGRNEVTTYGYVQGFLPLDFSA